MVIKRKVVSIYFDGEFNTENMKMLQGELMEYDEEEWINLYIKSDGGSVSEIEVLLDTLEDYKERLFLIATSHVGSSALSFYLKYDGFKKALPFTYGIAHSLTAYTEGRGTGFISKYNKSYIKQIEELNKEHKALLESVFTKEDYRDYDEDKDVFVSHKKLKKLDTLPDESDYFIVISEEELEELQSDEKDVSLGNYSPYTTTIA